MSNEINNEGKTRYAQRSKRKKTNLILNGLIVAVIILIVFVSYSIFHTNDEKIQLKIKQTNRNQDKKYRMSMKQLLRRLNQIIKRRTLLQKRKRNLMGRKLSQKAAVTRMLLKRLRILPGSLLEHPKQESM
ncbi:hypothetical protein AAHH67_11500 [Niallia circulans]